MHSRLLLVFAFVAGKNVDSFFEVDANGPLALQGSVEGDPFKKTGRELRRIKEDDSGERLGFLSKVEGAEGSRTLNSSDLFSIPRQLGGRDTESSQPPEGTQQQEPAAIPSSIPRVFVPEEQTVVPEGDNFAGGSRLLNDSDLGVSIPRQFGPQRSYTQQQEPAAIPSDIPHVFAAEEKTEVPEKDNCAIPRNIPHGSVREEKPEVPEEDNCIICLEPKNEESIAPFKCATVKHSFCKGCVKRWIPINPTCPSCRTGLRSDSPLNALRPTVANFPLVFFKILQLTGSCVQVALAQFSRFFFRTVVMTTFCFARSYKSRSAINFISGFPGINKFSPPPHPPPTRRLFLDLVNEN